MAIVRILQIIWRNLRRRLLLIIAMICLISVFLYNGSFRNTEISELSQDLELLERWLELTRPRKFSKNLEGEGQSLLKFVYPPYAGNKKNFTYDNGHLYPCTLAPGEPQGQVEDLMCLPRPNFIPGLKNPCFKANNRLHCLPYYQLLGFDKCGTTDLHSRLTSHPLIMKCNAYLGKEIYYWGWRRHGLFARGPMDVMTFDEYAYAFRDAASSLMYAENTTNQRIVGDGGPVDGWDFRGWRVDPQNKLYSEPSVLTPHFERHLLQDPKFIFIMREPADRLYSDFFFFKIGNTSEKFHEDVTVSIKIMNSCLRTKTTRQCFYSNYLYWSMPVRLHISCYSIFLREWLAVFDKRHFLFLRTEDYQRDIRGSLEKIFSFLDVDALSKEAMDAIIQAPNKLENTGKRSAGPMSNKTRKLLNDFYAPCNEDLSNILEDKRYLWMDND